MHKEMEAILRPPPRNGKTQAPRTSKSGLSCKARWSCQHLFSLASGLNSLVQNSEVPQSQRICWVLCQSKFPGMSRGTCSVQHLTSSWSRRLALLAARQAHTKISLHTALDFCHPLSSSVITSKFNTRSLMMVPWECDNISLPLLDKCICPSYPTFLTRAALD